MIYDCFLYYDEDMLLEIRLNTLSKAVDRFVIVESTHTFTGKPRKLNFDINKYNKFKEKIIYIIHDEKPILKVSDKFNQDREVNPWAPEFFEVDAWANEEAQRNKIMAGLLHAKDNDIILISDVDEIFNPSVLKKINPARICTSIYMNFYNYQFNLQVFNSDKRPRQCKAPKAVTLKKLKSFFRGEPETVRNIKKSDLKNNFLKWNWYKLNNQIIHNGGWHFFMDNVTKSYF